MRLWTIQGIEIYEQLQRDGVAYCTKPAWSDDEKFMKAYQWMADEMKKRIGEPQLMNKLDVDEVELVLPVPSVKSNSTGVSEGVSNRVPNGVSDTAKAIYSHIQADPNISRNELVNLTGISLKNVQKHINRLKELGLIRRIGSTRFGYWEIIE